MSSSQRNNNNHNQPRRNDAFNLEVPNSTQASRESLPNTMQHSGNPHHHNNSGAIPSDGHHTFRPGEKISASDPNKNHNHNNIVGEYNNNNANAETENHMSLSKRPQTKGTMNPHDDDDNHHQPEFDNFDSFDNRNNNNNKKKNTDGVAFGTARQYDEDDFDSYGSEQKPTTANNRNRNNSGDRSTNQQQLYQSELIPQGMGNSMIRHNVLSDRKYDQNNNNNYDVASPVGGAARNNNNTNATNGSPDYSRTAYASTPTPTTRNNNNNNNDYQNNPTSNTVPRPSTTTEGRVTAAVGGLVRSTTPEYASNNNNNNNKRNSPYQQQRPSNDVSGVSGFLDEEDGESAERGSVNSAGIGSAAGTNSTGTGDGEDEAGPLITVMMDVLHKADKLQAFMAANPDKSPGAISMSLPGLTPAEGSLTPVSGGGGANTRIRKHAALLKAARQQQPQLFAQLDQKSARACVIADPVASEILWVNEAAERLFGRLDLIGDRLESLMPDEIGIRHAGIIASYRDRYRIEYRKSGSAPDSRLLDIVKPRRMTVIRKYNGRDDPLRIDAWVRTLRLADEPLDEMPRLMALEAFEAQTYHEDSANARIFKSALENVSDAIVVADFNGTIEYINRSAELLCGYPLSALKAVRASVNMLVPHEMVTQHEGFLQHFRNNRKAAAASMNANSHEIVVQRRTEMRTAFGKEEILLRVEVAFDKLIGFLKSTREFIPREDFDNERLKLLLPASIVKLLRGATSVSDITSYFWEFDNRTVMFTDVAGFSNWAKSRPVKAVHDRMQPMFAEFEAIIQAFGGELIHRIGDAVMVIFGFNGEERHHARYALACAVELQQWSVTNGFMVRIGLHSGSIGAGIYGSDKGRPSFDAWGPVVNIAKRLEAYGEEGNVHFSKQVRDALGHRFSSQLHMILKEKKLEGIKGVQDGEQSFILPVKHPEANQIILPEKFMQLVGFQRAKFARWKIANEETERRLAELQKASR